MHRSHRRNHGFTIVEMIVIVGIIGLLLALVLPAVVGATNKARKHEESSHARQYFVAWQSYANSNKNKVIPGYLDHNVQELWKSKWRYSNGQYIVDQGGDGWELVAPYTWRLARYLDFSLSIIIGYQDDDHYVVGTEADDNNRQAMKVALQPGFGYNGYYIGGWYDDESIITPEAGGSLIPRPKYVNAGVPALGSDVIRNLVVSTPAGILKPDRLIVFCSSSQLPQKTVDGIPFPYRKWDRTTPGSHIVVGPWRETSPVWARAGTSIGQPGAGSGVEVYASAGNSPSYGVPIGRYTGSAVTVRADGHVQTSLPGALDDQRLWINDAEDVDLDGDGTIDVFGKQFQHTD